MSKTNLDRRDFLKCGSAASVVAATIPASLTGAAEQLPNEKGPFDVVISGGRVIDPETGLDATRHVGIRGGRTAAVSNQKLEGKKTLSAEGQIVALGCIDLHAHGQHLPAAWMQAFLSAA
jgi:N-acyl-D-glutamate deacylase